MGMGMVMGVLGADGDDTSLVAFAALLFEALLAESTLVAAWESSAVLLALSADPSGRPAALPALSVVPRVRTLEFLASALSSSNSFL
jgi:hypothetical protein